MCVCVCVRDILWCALIRIINYTTLYQHVASQMWLLGRLLPVMVGNKVPQDDERWKNYVMMVEITDHLFAPRYTADDVGYLEHLIQLHHSQFAELYPSNSIIPKMHYIVHMPRIMHK